MDVFTDSIERLYQILADSTSQSVGYAITQRIPTFLPWSSPVGDRPQIHYICTACIYFRQFKYWCVSFYHLPINMNIHLLKSFLSWTDALTRQSSENTPQGWELLLQLIKYYLIYPFFHVHQKQQNKSKNVSLLPKNQLIKCSILIFYKTLHRLHTLINKCDTVSDI